MALRPAYANALIARGSARISLGKFAEAAADYSAAHAADPSLAAPLFGLAEAYRQLGEPAKAIDHHLRVFAPERARQGDVLRAKGSQDERAVRDALGARDAHIGGDRLRQRHNFNHIRQWHIREATTLLILALLWQSKESRACRQVKNF